MSIVDRRRSRRYVVTENILVVLEGQKDLPTGTLVNISPEGAYVATPAQLSPGDRVTLTILVPDGPSYSLRLPCMVAWSNGNRVAASLREGYGFEFLAERRARERARKLIEELKARNSAVELIDSAAAIA